MLSKKLVEIKEKSSDNISNISSMQQGLSNILVSIRVRPLTKKELEIN